MQLDGLVNKWVVLGKIRYGIYRLLGQLVFEMITITCTVGVSIAHL
jgi:hypothetical protein